MIHGFCVSLRTPYDDPSRKAGKQARRVLVFLRHGNEAPRIENWLDADGLRRFKSYRPPSVLDKAKDKPDPYHLFSEWALSLTGLPLSCNIAPGSEKNQSLHSVLFMIEPRLPLDSADFAKKRDTLTETMTRLGFDSAGVFDFMAPDGANSRMTQEAFSKSERRSLFAFVEAKIFEAALGSAGKTTPDAPSGSRRI